MLIMGGWVVISLLVCISITAHAQNCSVEGGNTDYDFPSMQSLSDLSYEMTVEYTVPNANQTDYYVEFYDESDQTGRVEIAQNGKTSTYMYASRSWEAWEINDNDCVLKNITDPPRMFKDDQSEWLYNENSEDDGIKRTIGPSSMLKKAFSVWNSTERSTKMAYMGIAEEPIRGLNAQYWRRCMDDKSFVHYYFSIPNAGDKKSKALPLRVIFGGSRKGEDVELNDQVYDIMHFRSFIPEDLRPFDLPKGKGCRRGPLVDAPDLPDLKDKSLDFSAEVIYRKINYDGTDAKYWSYYSTLKFALDQLSGLLAYRYAPWSSKKADDGEFEVKTPRSIVYDTKHHYAYNTSLENGTCEIIREKNFDPYYLLPDNAGRISLTDPSILFPNNEFQFLSQGVNRGGLKVNIFERVIENFEIELKDGTPSQVPKAIVTHSYLQDNYFERNLVTVENALTQVQFTLFGRQPKVIETLTFNFFSFSTEVKDKMSTFNVKRCFKNDDDYVWVTIGFNVDESVASNLEKQVPSIQSNVVNLITLKSELSPGRIPYAFVDFSEGLYVSLMILGKPPVMLDYNGAQPDTAIIGAAEEDGIEDLEDCATSCLEQRENCWGFSICGSVCAYGTVLAAKPGPKKGCFLYRRFDQKTFIPSKESMIEDLRIRIQSQQFKLMVLGDDDTIVQVDASSIEVSEPGEDDRMFWRLGNRLNPRMRVLKTGGKLKGIGTEIKNMGKLRYDECQKECLDYKDCETASYCLSDQKCVFTNKYGEDLKPEDMVDDNMCNIVTRKYEDHFERTPGISLSITAEEILQETDSEKCARACLKSSKFNCLSFDHCPTDKDAPCKLHTVHYPNPNTREKVQERSTSCGHYFRKFSTEFKKNPERRTAGSSLPPLTNLTIEECAKNCVEFGKGVCFGFDFCQGSTILATSCTLLDKPMPNYKTVENKMCINFIRAETQASPLPYSNGYAGGIGFLCFLIGGIVGALIIFGVAYLRVNRR